MKIVLIFRKHRPGAYSIETLFQSIATELRRHVEVIEYETTSRWLMPVDVYQLRRLDADIYHVTGDIHYITLLLPRRATVLTVHDIGNYLYGLRGLKRLAFRLLWLELPILQATAVTSVSNKTRDDIAEHLAVSARSIHVIQNCYSPNFRPIPKELDLARPTILQVGTQPYKNLPRVLNALHGIPCRLHIVGRLDYALKKQLQDLAIEYENFFDLEPEELVDVYASADLVTFVSVGEGFGLPILEAQVVGRPLVTSDTPPLRDVAGRGACLVDPLDIASIRRGILRLLNDAPYREHVVARGRENVACYSPSVVASAYLSLYQRIVAPSNQDNRDPSRA